MDRRSVCEGAEWRVPNLMAERQPFTRPGAIRSGRRTRGTAHGYSWRRRPARCEVGESVDRAVAVAELGPPVRLVGTSRRPVPGEVVARSCVDVDDLGERCPLLGGTLGTLHPMPLRPGPLGNERDLRLLARPQALTALPPRDGRGFGQEGLRATSALGAPVFAGAVPRRCRGRPRQEGDDC